MDEHMREKIALFRFSVIGPLINGELAHGELKRKMKELSLRVYAIPDSRRRHVGRGTIEEWLYLYKHNGYDGLKPKNRSDRGKTRSISDEVLRKISLKKQEKPRRPIALICWDMYRNKEIDTPNQPLSTIYRYLHHKNPNAHAIKMQQKRYASRYANEMWQSDVMHGPWIPHQPGGKSHKTYLIAVIDDASRLIVGAGFYPAEKLINLKKILKEAIHTYGIPTKLYVDNGKIYKSHDMEIACAKIQIHLIYATPYQPRGKGKIERFFRRVREQFLTGIQNIHSLQELNEAFSCWLRDQYNRCPHSGIEGQKPLDVFLKLAHHIRRIPADIPLEELFYRKENRQVQKDSTFRVWNRLYEAPEHLIGKKIDVFFDYDDLSRIVIRYQGKSEGACKPIDYIDNSKIKRKPLDNKEDEDNDLSGFFA
ncbi:DDE-type integrase/transposase/recombinase [Fibrobacterota bacterium]